MNRTVAATAAAAILLPAGLAAVVLAGPAGAQPTGASPAGDAASTAMLAAMQRDLGLTEKAARERIAGDDAAARIELALRKKLGPAFAGAWLGADSKLVVAVSESSRTAEVTAAGATAKVVANSGSKLDLIKEKLDAAAAKAPAGKVPGWYVDVKTNSVVVQAHGATTAAKAFIKASGVDAAAVRVETTAELPRLFYDVRGGDAYYIGGGRCSVGFSVNGGFVTAGHCGDPGNATTGFNRVAQGTFQGSSFPGNDYAWVAVNSNWVPQPWVNNYSGGNVTVAGSTVAAIGAAICRSGSTTGWRCGTVQAYNQTVNYAEGSVSGLTRTNACAEPGDSGGSWLSGQQAQGVTSGGSGNCTSGGTTYFQPVNEILTAYGRTLVTSGGGGTTPPTTPPTGCSGYEFSVNGSLASGGSAYQPDNSYYYSSASGTHRACLDGPTGTDFDLYLQKWNGSAWSVVAQGATSAADETASYTGTSGYYRWRVHAYNGSGSYALGYTNP
ncbi:S1 family peptidase [Actinoplanes aureus]|uniref:S1 family peptidase n=1 Tax=Actinoplanes aureus TaxID=2792083 RepID=A0A931C8W6_9ACTN|nr:S1 family peptidase [Actinoplanes aureus]MBG0562226.1 S1 family peptidase [Actinoplanes aureus]